MKKNLLFSILAILLLLGGGIACAVLVKNAQVNLQTEDSAISAEISEESETLSETVPETKPIKAPSYPEELLSLPEIQLQDSVMTVEAEHADLTGNLYAESVNECSNGQCVSGFSKQEGDTVKAAFMIPSAQYYDVTVSVRATAPGTNSVMLNQKKIGDFTLTDTTHFVRVTFSGFYLPAGQAEVALQETDGNFSIDYFEISNNTELQNIRYRSSYELSDKQASENTRKLMQYLTANYGKKMLSGQYVSTEQNTELDSVYQITGKYPAIRFCDLRTNPEKQIVPCEKWAEQGGIVGCVWNWDAPSGTPEIESEKTDFSLKEVVSQTDVSMLSEDEMKTISESCSALLHDIDRIAEVLKPLAEKDIPVLWRPLPEAGGGWYWWGADGAEAYRWLWNTVYQRLTNYHQLHNLIWIWNGQNENYLVSNYDIASFDIYLPKDEPFNSRYEQFVSLYRMTKHDKILALTECSAFPDMNEVFAHHTVWSFAGLWYDDTLSKLDNETLIHFYNSEKTLTLSDVQNN